MPKFSIITPVRLGNGSSDRSDRLEKFEICIKSVENQVFKDFEWIVVNDGSPTEFNWSGLLFNQNIPSVNLVSKEHAERVVALNTALKLAKGDWICFLDSDDELKPHYLERINFYLKKFPGHKLFNFGCVYCHLDGNFSFRDPFNPKRKGKGHEVFGGGNIVNGTYVFHRSIYEKEGGFPGEKDGFVYSIDCTEINYPLYKDQKKPYVRDLYMGTPYDFSAAAQLEFPEIRQYFMVDHIAEPEKILKELGNPWGQDYYLFYKYTRKNYSKAIREYLYIVNPKP